MDHAAFPFELKGLSETGAIKGLAAGYGNLDSHGEVFAQGAFKKSLESMRAGGRQPAMLLHHDARRPVGRWDGFTESARGLEVEGGLVLDTADGREAYALLKGGALTGLSVGFRPITEKKGENGSVIITEASLFEISLVSVPSNPITRISSVKGVGSVRDLEEILKEAGMSSRQAKRAAGAAFIAAEKSGAPEISEKAVRGLSRAIDDLNIFNRS